MDIKVTPRQLRGCLSGVVTSKSQAHRALICAAFSDRKVRITGLNDSADIKATAGCLEALGAGMDINDGTVTVRPVEKVTHGAVLDCGESGSTLRFLLPVAAAMESDACFIGHGRLPSRPMSPLLEEMEKKGVSFDGKGSLPLKCAGRLRGGEYTMPGNISSQFISGLMMALPLTGEESVIRVTGRLESGPYAEMTRDVLGTFGIDVRKEGDRYIIPGGQRYRGPEQFRVEGDWSGAAFWLVAGALSDEGVECRGMNMSSVQGDMAILDILEGFGAEVKRFGDGAAVRHRPLKGMDIQAGDIPDLVPVIAVTAAYAEGDTRIGRIGRLRLKESDRAETVTGLVRALGGSAEIQEDEMIIHGAGGLEGGTAETFGDHRIVMAAAAAATRASGPVRIRGAEAAAKSYPDFFARMRELGGEWEEDTGAV